MQSATSTDGVKWSAPVVLRRDVSDIVSWARFKGRYIAPVKLIRDGYKVGGQNDDAPGRRRIVALTTSRDGRHWTKPRDLFLPDHDPGVTEFYSVGGMIRRGGLLLGFLRVLRDDLPATPGGPVYGTGYTVLAWTRDGTHWHRDKLPFLDRGKAGGWDHAMAWADSQLIVGKQATYVYYGGYRSGHKINRDTERQLGLARLRLDGYVARVAGKRTGVLETRPLDVGRLLLNARVRSAMRIDLLRDGAVFGSCRVAPGDYVYGGACKLPTGRYAVRFTMRQSELYGIES